mgnify:CR=1 FL=1
MPALTEIREQFHTGAFDFKKASEIGRLLGIPSRSGREALARILSQMEKEGEIVRDERGRYVSPERLGLIKGTVQGSGRGFAFLLREEGEDLFLPPRSLHGALHGDVVYAKLIGGERGDEAAVYSVIKRGMRRVVGTYFKDRRGGIVEPDDKRFAPEVRITGGLRAAPGEKAVVEIDAYPDGKAPEGRICEILGESGDLMAEEEGIIAAHELRAEFPQKALAEAAKAAAKPVAAAIANSSAAAVANSGAATVANSGAAGRRDFRGECIITIDGDDSRDFDDAVTLTEANGRLHLGVHIADVSHYVKRGGALDKEAYARGTSVYFPDRVLPMLPESLSNGICSLSESEDRLVLSCLIDLDGEGTVLGSEFCEGVICSAHRMTYSQVTAILEGDAELRGRFADVVPMLEKMRSLAERLYARRKKRGAVDLDVREAHITYQDGKIGVEEHPRTVSHRIIEEFMLLANEAAAQFAAEYDLPFLYRVHEKPGEERAEAFRTYLRELGLSPAFRPDNVRPGEYSKIIDALEAESSPLRSVVNRMMLRSMSKARYGDENVGHFGLASRCYCHFTSPIRRYPDLVVHRIIKSVLAGDLAEAHSFAGFVKNAGISCSESERRADEAERDVDALYEVFYMREHIGEEYDAVVSGVTSFAVFAELPSTIEGRIGVEDLPPDDYTFVEERCLLQGRRHAYAIGDAIRVQVAGCDIGTRRVLFVPAENNKKSGRAKEDAQNFGKPAEGAHKSRKRSPKRDNA